MRTLLLLNIIALSGYSLCSLSQAAGSEVPTNMRPAIPKTCSPSGSTRLGTEGTVSVAALIDVKGKMKDIKVIQSSGSEKFDKEAIQYFSRCKFSPAKRNGIPIEIWQPLQYKWGLNK